MNDNLLPLSQLKEGESGIIKQFEDASISLKLMEIGCLPGEPVTVAKIAPFGGPFSIKFSDFTLSLRRKDAASIIVEKIIP